MILYNSENNNKEKILSNDIKKTYCNKEIDYDVNIMKILIFFNLYSTSIDIFSLLLFSLLSFTNCNTILIILFFLFHYFITMYYVPFFIC